MKRKLLLAAVTLVAAVFGGGGKASAQGWTDVTSTYITNADLKDVAANSTTNGEMWSVYTTGRSGNTQHPNNWYLHTNGTTNHNGGGNYFECWAADQGVKRWTLFQDLTLPAGQYRLTGQYSTNESRGIIKTVVITPHHTYFSTGITTSNWGTWGSETAEFTIYEETQVRVGMISTNFAQNHGFTLETKGAKQLLADVIASAPTGVSTTDAQAVYDNGSSDDAAYRVAAKTLHDAIVAQNITDASVGAPVDMTDYILNPSFEGVGGETPYVNGAYGFTSSWSYPEVDDGNAVSATRDGYLIKDNTEDGFYYANLWKGSAITYYVKQTLASLPAGRYILSAKYASDADNTALLYMGTTANSTTLTATNKSSFVSGSVIYDLETAGDVEIGMTSESWMKADGFTLSYVGDPLNAAKGAWQTAYDAAVAARDNDAYSTITGAEKTALLAAIALTPSTIETYGTAADALTAATADYNATTVSYYALLATEKTKAASLGMTTEAINTAAAATKKGLVALQDLKVAEYNYVTTNFAYGVTLGTWTKINATDRDGQHWDGKATSKYSEMNEGWENDSWTCSYTQDLNLPAGDYVFKVAGRTSAGNSTITLNVTNKTTSSVLGTVNDFPKGDVGLGINTSGETDYATGEGHTYAFSNKGRGWEWRYVKFTLASDATVTVSINGAGNEKFQWVGFCNPTVQTNSEANIALIEYNIALNSAVTLIADATYTNVGGTDKSNLQADIANDASLDKTSKTAIETATGNLNTHATTFTAGVANWNAYTYAKSYGELINSTLLPYATAAKITAVETALATTVNTAAEAETAAEAINTANRTAYESNAIAENVAGAKDRTSLIKNADGSNTAGWSGSFWTATSEAYTEADGNATNTYFDKNGVKEFTSSQTIKLPKGNYILSVTARAQSGIGSYKLKVTNNANEDAEVDLIAMGNANGVFNRGWNDFTVAFEQKAYGDATIAIVGDNTTSDANFWMSWDRFRLYCIGEEGAVEISENAAYTPVSMSDVNVNLTRTIKKDVVNTIVLPFSLTQSQVTAAFGEGSKVYGISSYDSAAGSIDFGQVSGITAHIPCILKATNEGISYNFTEVTLVATSNVHPESPESNKMKMVGSYEASYTIPTSTSSLSNYVVSGGKLYYVDTDNATMKNTRAYFSYDGADPNYGASAKPISFIFDDEEGDDATGIAEINSKKAADSAIYNMAGQRVGADYKGVVIKNGKKVFVK